MKDANSSTTSTVDNATQREADTSQPNRNARDLILNGYPESLGVITNQPKKKRPYRTGYRGSVADLTQVLNSLQSPVGAATMGRVRDWHSPRNNDCAHNMSPGSDCTCKRQLRRNNFRVVRVNDTSVDMHKVSSRIAVTIHPGGLMVFREHGRKKTYSTTVGTIYTKLVWHEAITAAKQKKAARKARRAK